MNPDESYCVRCRTARRIDNPESVTTKNGRPATKGKCLFCGTVLFRFEKKTA